MKNVVGIIGGSGLYHMEGLENVSEERIETPFGDPSDLIVRGMIGETELCFIARHARNHSLLPSEVNYRANIYALKLLGAKWCIAVTAVGSLQEQYKPGDIVVPDQIIDRTKARESTFFGDGLVAHVSFGDPYCPVLRNILLETAREHSSNDSYKVHDAGTYVCMEGPAFSTRAESNMYRSFGAAVIGMTNLPEAKLAREAEMAYASLSMVTDYDCWRMEEESVDAASIMAVLKNNSTKAKEIVRNSISKISASEPSEMASKALSTALITPLSDVPKAKIEALSPLLKNYL